MDRELDDSLLRRDRNRRLLMALTVIAALALAFFALRAAIEPGLDLDQVRVSTVQRADLIATVDVSGTVIPHDELVLAAPFAAEIRERMVLAGAQVTAGQALMRLEVRPLLAQIATLEERIAIQQNTRDSRELELRQALSERRGRRDLLLIDLESREAREIRLETLADIGAISKGELLEAQLNVRRTQVELQQIEQTIANLEASHAAALTGIDLEVSILAKQLAEQRRLAELAVVVAPRDGVVTWILAEAGASVALGQQLARVADISRFRVEATASDYYAPRLYEGMNAVVRVGSMSFDGLLSSLAPSATEGVMTLFIDFADIGDVRLRPQLRAEIELITDEAPAALVANRGPGLQGSGKTMAWRIDGDRAVKTEVELGLSNRRQIEILAGVEAGHQLIVSETTDIDHLESIKLK